MSERLKMRCASIIMLTLLLAACGGGDDSKVTQTRMDDIDSLEGTISDEMPDTDALNEQPMIEAAPPPSAKPKAKAENSGDNAEVKKTAAPKLTADPAVAKAE
jgi:hypothetical protein